MMAKASQSFSSRRAGVWTALLLAVAALPAAGDWLVLRTGARSETKGPWQVKGKLVVFTAPNGTLSSLRLSDVDLAASERATVEAKAQAEKPPEPPPPPRRKSIRSLTDADFARKPPPAPAAGEGEAAGEAAKPEAKDDGQTEQKSTVAVSSWNQVNRTEGDGLDLVGALRNDGNLLATDVTLTVKVYDDEGTLLKTADAILASTSLPPGGTTSFRVPLPTVFTFARASFETRNTTVTLDPIPEKEGAATPPPGRP
jgi:hypothetical protein